MKVLNYFGRVHGTFMVSDDARTIYLKNRFQEITRRSLQKLNLVFKFLVITNLKI